MPINPMKQMVRQRGERGRALSDGSRAPQTNFGRHRDTYRLSAQQSGINGWTWKTPSFNLQTKAHMEQTTTFLPLLLFSFLTVSKREGLIYGSLLLCLIRITISSFTIAIIYVTTPRQLQLCREIMIPLPKSLLTKRQRAEQTETPRHVKGEVQ